MLAFLVVAAAWGESAGGQVRELVRAGKVAEAAAVACQWANDEPGNPEALSACAELGRRAGRYSAAEDALHALVFFEPNVPDTLVKLGEVLIDRGRYEDARERFEAAIHLVDSFGPAFVGLARLERYTSEVPADVLSAAEVAQSVEPDSAAATAALGGAYLELGRHERALELLDEALELDRNYAPGWFDKGLAHARAGDDAAAQQAWEQYIKLEPATGEAWKLEHRLVVAGGSVISDRSFYACFSPDGRKLAYRARGAGGWGIYLRETEPPGEEKLLWATEANLQSLDFSPDGSQLLARVYERTTVEENGQRKQQWTYRLYLVPSDGGAEGRQVFEDRWLGEPAWIPGSGQIGVRSYVPREGYVLLSIDPATGKQTALPGTDNKVAYYTPRWSADGRSMLVVRRSDMRPDGSYSYELLAGPGDDLSRLQVIFGTEEYIRSPRFSPDGEVILFSLALGSSSQRYPTWAMPADGSREPCLVDYAAGSSNSPEVSPDGRYLLAAREYGLYLLRLTGLREE